MSNEHNNIFLKYFFLAEYGDKIFKSIILASVILCLCFSRSIADKRTDFIPSHKVVQLDSMKTSLVGKGSFTKVFKELIPAKNENNVTDTLNSSMEQKVSEKKIGKKEPVYRGHLAKRKNTELKQKLQIADTLSKIKSSEDTITDANELLSSHQLQLPSENVTQRDTIKSSPKKSVTKKTPEDGRRARIINVVAIIFVIIGIVFFALQSSGFFSKRSKVDSKKSTFSTDIGDINEEVVTYSRPTHKNIFDTISEREEESTEKSYEPLFHEEEDEFAEYQNANLPVNQDTIHLAKKFRRGQGEVELAMKMSSHRSNVSNYSEKVIQIPAFENETPTGRKKDAGALAKKLGIGKGEVLLARHLEEIEHKQTKG